jgi:hypothetical protein
MKIVTISIPDLLASNDPLVTLNQFLPSINTSSKQVLRQSSSHNSK